MLQTGVSLARNVWRTKVRKETYLEPMLAVFYITKLCNYSCNYCTEFGASKNAGFKKELLNTEEALDVLRIVRQACEGIYFTGGEPTLRRDIVELAQASKRDLGFAVTAMNTNGSMLHKREALFDHIDCMVVSLDTMNVEKADAMYEMPAGTSARVLDNLRTFAPEQQKRGFEMTATCVTNPESIEDADAVFDFCLDTGIEFSIQVLEVDGIGPHPALKTSKPFRALVDRAIREKRANTRAVSGSMAYLEGLLEMKPFDCYPTLNPRVDSLGKLYWPCHPLHKEVGDKVDLRAHGSWDAAVAYARATYGDPPKNCHRCYLRCYAELSMLVQQPHRFGEAVFEKIGLAVVRRAGLGASPA